MFNFLKRTKDFFSVGQSTTVAGINIPVITLERYPGIVERGVKLTEVIAEVISKREGKPLDQVIEDITVTDLLTHIPVVFRIAANELFEFVAYVLETEVTKVRKLSLGQLIRVIKEVYKVNEFAEVESEIRNFILALAAGQKQKAGKGTSQQGSRSNSQGSE